MDEREKPVILCVDDDKRILALLKDILEPEGYDLRFSLSEEDALLQMSVEVPDIILLDITLPGESGLELLKRIVKDERTKKVPVIMLTGSEEIKDAEEAMGLGAVSYINKPFNIDLLKSLIPGFLRKVKNDGEQGTY